MPSLLTRADSLREYLTGAGSDGDAQTLSTACTGGYRSSTETLCMGISLAGALANISVDYASGGCAPGAGTLTCVDANDVTWADATGSAGAQLNLPSNGSQGIAETLNTPGSFLRITRTSASAISGGPCTVTLSVLQDNYFGFTDVSSALATSGESEYRASMLKNVAAGNVTNLYRWINTLGTQQAANGGAVLGASGAGTISTTGSFASWPSSGWVNIQTSGGALREIAYYTSRTTTVLTIPAAGRSLLGTTAAAGANTDVLNAVPGIAIALDPAGIQGSGTSIETIATTGTAPAGVTWNLGITQATGLNIGTLTPGQQIGIWMWRQIPAGAISTPAATDSLITSFDAA